MRNHRWVESSGTTEVCGECGCLRLGRNRERHPVGIAPPAYTVWLKDRWSLPNERATSIEPPCLADERGHTVPDLAARATP